MVTSEQEATDKPICLSHHYHCRQPGVWRQNNWHITSWHGAGLQCHGAAWVLLARTASVRDRGVGKPWSWLEDQLHRGAGDPQSLCVHHVPMLGFPMAEGQSSTAGCTTGACRQLPLGISNYTTSMALPLSKNAARSCDANVLSVWQ